MVFRKLNKYKIYGRPRNTWVENVKADMAELEIDKEDVHVGWHGEIIL